MGKKNIRLSDLRFEVDSDSSVGKAIEYIQKNQGRNYNEAIAQILIMRYLPLALPRNCPSYEAIAIEYALECQRKAESISIYGGLALERYRYRYPELDLIENNKNVQECSLPDSKEAALKLVINRLEKTWFTNVRESVVETVLNCYLPYAVPYDHPWLDVVVAKCTAACLSWANEIREYGRLPLLERVLVV